MKRIVCLSVLWAFVMSSVQASTFYPLHGDSRVVGQEETYQVDLDGVTTLEHVAAEYSLGLSNLIEANPLVDPIVVRDGTNLLIPNRVILPPTVHNGIIINSAEMRLYYYHDNGVEVFPIGIGQLGKGTPVKWTTKVERKRANPTWTPTAAMRAEYAAMGDPLPAVVPAGPDNPMGLFALYVGRLYAIHGTNAEFGIGLRVSHGCVRLRSEDIERLFNVVPVGTRVEFINQPIKYSIESNGDIYIEVHQPLSRTEAEYENFSEDNQFTFSAQDRAFFSNPAIDQSILARALQERSGRPVLLNPAQF